MKTQAMRYTREERMIKFLIPALFTLLFISVESHSQDFWQQTNGPSGGPVNALAISADGHIFAGTNGSVFRSSDNGSSWLGINRGFISLGSVEALTVNSAGRVFIGTSYGEIFRSTEFVDAWTKVFSTGTFDDVNALAAKANGTLFAGSDAGVFRSADGGNSWLPVNVGLLDTIVISLAIHSNGDIFVGTRSNGIFRSTDEGDSWTPLSTAGLTDKRIQALTFNSTGDIFVGTSSEGVFRIANNGNRWTAINTNLTNKRINAFASDATGRIWVGTEGGVFYTTNNGNSWIASNVGLKDNHINSITVNGNGDVFLGSDAGVFRSSDRGSSWNETNAGLANATVNDCIVHPSWVLAATNKGAYRITLKGWEPFFTEVTGGINAFVFDANRNLFAAGGGGIFRSDFGDLPWEKVASTSSHALAISPNGNIFAGGAFEGGVLRSSNGQSWVSVNDGLANRSVFSLAINTNGDIFAGTNGGGIFRSTDNGESWIAVNNGLQGLIVQDLVVNQNGHIFAAAFGDKVYRSINNGNSWTSVDNGLTNRYVWSLTINATGNVFAGTIGDGVFRSLDNGECWTRFGSDLDKLSVYSLFVDAQGVMWAGTIDRGVFRTVKTTELPAYPSRVRLNNAVDYPSFSNTSDYKPEHYRIIGLPGKSDSLITKYLAGEQREDWQVVWDNGDTSKFFVEFNRGQQFRLSAGRAFWLIHKGRWTVNDEVSSAPLDSCQAAFIPLHRGWNLITNPFLSAVPWSLVTSNNDSIKSPIWRYNGENGFSTSDTLRPYEGYYFDNSTELTALKIPYPPFFALSPAPSLAASPFNWNVNVKLSSNEFTDQSASFGVAINANKEIDDLDLRKPRAVVARPSIYFKLKKVNEGRDTYATDIRPEFAEKESWDFEVQSTQRKELKLTFSGITRVPSQFEIYLIDKARARSLNLRVNSLYSFTPAADISNFTVLVGKAEALQEQLQPLVPRELSLGQNYPNPFNPQTAIPVTIPAITDVQLKIYDLLGREVKTLHSGPLTPGRHFFFWNGKDESGNIRASGIYFYRLQTSAGLVLTHKMIFMK